VAAPGPARRWWRDATGGLPRPFWFLWAGTLVNRLGYFVAPFLTLYLVREEGLEPTAAGAVMAGFGFGSLLSQPLGGWLSDRLGRRPTLTAGMVATAVAYLALGAARPLSAVAVCAFAAGLATDLYRPAVAAMVADLVDPADRQRAYGLLYWAINLGVGVATVAGGALAERSFGLLFVADAATCLGFAVVVARAVPETRPAAAADQVGYRTVLRDPLLVALSASSLAAAAVYLQFVVTLPLAMRADGLDAQAYGLAVAVNPALIVLAQPLVARLLRDRPALDVYAASGVLAGLGFGLTAFVSTLPGYAATVGVWTLGEITLNLAAPTIVATIAPAAMRGRYLGVWGSSWGIASFLAPLAGTWTFQHLGSRPLWLGCLAVASVATLSLLPAGPALRRRERALDAPAPPATPDGAPVDGGTHLPDA